MLLNCNYSKSKNFDFVTWITCKVTCHNRNNSKGCSLHIVAIVKLIQGHFCKILYRWFWLETFNSGWFWAMTIKLGHKVCNILYLQVESFKFVPNSKNISIYKKYWPTQMFKICIIRKFLGYKYKAKDMNSSNQWFRFLAL